MDIKEKAKRINLVEFCKNRGIPLIEENSKNPKLAEYDSLVFFPDSIESQWYRYSTQKGGDAISFVEDYYNVNFKEAITILLDSNVHEIDPSSVIREKTEVFKYEKEYEVSDCSIAKKYLTEERKISPALVDLFINIGLLKQDSRNNAIFKWVDDGRVVGANRQGTGPQKEEERSWKKIDRGSTRDRGFNIKIGTPKTIRFFESSIDMMSYMSMNKNKLKNTWFIAMEGLKKGLFEHYVGSALKVLEQPPKIIYCVDNDRAGNEFAEKMLSMKSPYIFVEQPKVLKDWNDELIQLRTEKKKQRSYMPER